jgi:glycosyltransferase involved in cell wall biosynthesis
LRKQPHLLLLASYAPSLINFRGSLLEALVARGWRVTASAPNMDDVKARLKAMGVSAVETPLARTGMNPLADLAYYRSLLELFRSEKPDVLLAYTAKPVIWGTLAARIVGVPRVVAMITGLGYAFTSPVRPSIKHRAANLAARLLYRLALPRADHVLFQNPDDRELFENLGFTPSPDRVGVTAGSGIDLRHFTPSPPPEQPSFLMLARLLGAKGVREYAIAARRLKARYPNVDIRLAGPFDHGVDGVSYAELTEWTEGGIAYLGDLADVRPAIAEAAVYVLPSSYREGTPRSVLEALATGRPIITTDTPGCRETVIDGRNGFLIAPRDASALENAMEHFILDPSLIVPMAAASLDLARRKYDVNNVNAQILAALEAGQPGPSDPARFE